jgi:hypothetical protein
MPRSSPAAPGEPIRCEKKSRWSPAKPGEPIKSEDDHGGAWWSEKGYRRGGLAAPESKKEQTKLNFFLKKNR